MKKQKLFQHILLITLCLAAFSCSKNDNPEQPDRMAEYTVMLYGCGGGNLDPSLMLNLEEACTAGSTERVQMTAQIKFSVPYQQESGFEYKGTQRLLLDGIVIYLVDNEFYFGDRIYLGGEAEGEQYAFFARAILEALPRLDFTPEILHCNDWHTAVLPMLMKTQYAGRMQSRMQTLLTIHNIAYQGKFSFEFVQDLLGIDARYYTPEFMELNGCANLLKAGCVFADHINTVSPSYAAEIRTAAYGEGLEGILNARQHQLSGILNGIDTAVFDPAHDGGIAAPYSADDLSGKAACRAALCRELGLEIGAHTPIVAMVTRMTPQKGFDLVQCVLDELMDSEDMAFVLLGTGNAEYEDFMRSAEWRHKGRLCAYIGYDEALSHRVYAGSDFLLMPSSFEPCGLSRSEGASCRERV